MSVLRMSEAELKALRLRKLKKPLDGYTPPPKAQKPRKSNPGAFKPHKRSPGESAFAAQLTQAGISGWVGECRFYPGRRWRFDFAWPGLKLAVEIEGGVWSRGRHTRGKGFQDDLEKYNTAALEGWTVLRFTTEQAENGEAYRVLMSKWSVLRWGRHEWVVDTV